MARKIIWLLILIATITTPGFARDILMDDPLPDPEFVEPEKKWLENEVQAPDKIDPDDLEEFKVAANEKRLHYFLERGSIQHGSDGVVRFTLIIRSQSGATNSSYEGVRCGERLYKVYAYGGRETLNPIPGTTWEAISKDESTDYRAALYEDLLCNLQSGKPNPVDKVLEAMRNNELVGSHY